MVEITKTGTTRPYWYAIFAGVTGIDASIVTAILCLTLLWHSLVWFNKDEPRSRLKHRVIEASLLLLAVTVLFAEQSTYAG